MPPGCFQITGERSSPLQGWVSWFLIRNPHIRRGELCSPVVLAIFF